MKNKGRICLIAIVLASAMVATAQDDDHTITDAIGRTYLRPNGYSPAPPSTFAVGNAATSGYALDVHGEQMTPQLGDVFKTDAPGHMDTYWRMFHIAREYGNLFHLDQTADFNINATQGYLRFNTNTTDRMRLSPTLLAQTVNGYPGLDLSGFLGIGSFTPGLPYSVDRPFCMLHLDDHGAVDSGYRPWMRQGMMVTHGSDQSYFGMKDEGSGMNATVVAWSDNNMSEVGPDALKFIFVSHPGAGTGVAGLASGLEAARFTAVGTGNETYFGLGDWFTAGAVPSERFDMLNGRARIRQLPTDPVAPNGLLKFLVVDDTPGPDFGVVKWRNVPPGTGTDCAWWLAGGPGTDSNVLTAYNGGLACPQGNRRVGIGSATPIGKLGVTSRTVTQGGPPVGLSVNLYGLSTGTNTGMQVSVEPESGGVGGIQYGTLTEADNGASNYGLVSNAFITAVTSTLNIAVQGRAEVLGSGTLGTNKAGYFSASATAGAITLNIGSHNEAIGGVTAKGTYSTGTANSSTTNAYGVDAQANNATTANFAVKALANTTAIGTGTSYGVYAAGSNGSINYGVHAQAVGNSTSTNNGVWATAVGGATNWAGYFIGNVNVIGTGYYVGGSFVASDAQFKTNVEPLEDPLAVLMQLHPDRYNYLVDEFPQMNFPGGEHGGFIAQEVEQVLPSLVSQSRISAVTDSLGVEITPAVNYKAVNYAGLTPYLVGAVQQQQAMIDQQQSILDQQQATIAQMQDQINNCCAAQGGMAPHGNMEQKMAPQENDLQEQRLLIIPNPVADLTTLEYYVPKAGKVSLQVSSSDGKPLATLREELAEAGAYNYSWNTTKLAAGTYFCTFMLDGAVVVKRAVKVK